MHIRGRKGVAVVIGAGIVMVAGGLPARAEYLPDGSEHLEISDVPPNSELSVLAECAADPDDMGSKLVSLDWEDTEEGDEFYVEPEIATAPPDWSLHGYSCPPERPYAAVVTIPIPDPEAAGPVDWYCRSSSSADMDVDSRDLIYHFGILRRTTPTPPTLGQFDGVYRRGDKQPVIHLNQRGGKCYSPFNTHGYIKGIGGTKGRWPISGAHSRLAQLPVGSYKVKVTTQFRWRNRPSVVTAPQTAKGKFEVAIYNRGCARPAEIRRVKTGMTVAQVTTIIGGPGEVISRSADVVERSYSYCGLYDRSFLVGYVQGRVSFVVYD